MAASSRTSGIAGIGKRVISQIWSPNSPHPPPPSLALRRAAHTSVYDKNPEDQVTSTVVPDEVIEAPSDKYWAPHPKTGVFGPATDHHLRAHGELPKLVMPRTRCWRTLLGSAPLASRILRSLLTNKLVHGSNR